MILDGLIDIQCTNFPTIEAYFKDSTFSYYEENSWLNIKDISLVKNSEECISDLEKLVKIGNGTCFLTLLDNEYGYVKAYFENGELLFYCNYVMDMHYLRKDNKELMHFFIETMEHPYPILEQTYQTLQQSFPHSSNVELWNKLCNWHSEIYLIVTPFCFEVIDHYFETDTDQVIHLEDNLLDEILH